YITILSYITWFLPTICKYSHIGIEHWIRTLNLCSSSHIIDISTICKTKISYCRQSLVTYCSEYITRHHWSLISYYDFVIWIINECTFAVTFYENLLTCSSIDTSRRDNFQ